MDSKLETLPPLKRLRLLREELHDNKENVPPPPPNSYQLPSKKRMQSRDPLLLQQPLPATVATDTYCLPAKKRVWASQPHLCMSEFGNDETFKPYKKEQVEDDIKEALPAKKQIESREPLLQPPPPAPATDAYCLPAKKRVWAFQPHDLLMSEFGDDETFKPYQKGQVEDDIKQPPIPFQKEVDNDNGNDNDNDEEADDGIDCAVCQSTDGDPADPIVFCDGCDKMVQTTCYGNRLINGIPEGDWFCNQCLISQSDKQNTSISCCFCPSKAGVMKATKDGSWPHVCALLVPEVFFEDPVWREGIDCSMFPKRWDRKCYVCKRRKGCVIGCSEPNCHMAFHVTCGLNENLCIEYQQGKKRNDTIVAVFCKSHTELWKKV